MSTKNRGRDPYPRAKRKVTRALTKILNERERETGIDFVVDKMTWISPEIDEIAYPRGLYNPGVEDGSVLRFCDSDWRRCRLNRFDVDGPIERLLSVGVDRIVFIDLTTEGARFSKTYDCYIIATTLINDHNERNNENVVLEWANDPMSAMDASYPDADPNGQGSRQFKSNPMIDIQSIPILLFDPRLADFHVEGIEQNSVRKYQSRKQGFPVNHGIFLAMSFDPKINDTLILNNNIKDTLPQKYPDLSSANILSGWFGDLTVNEDWKVEASLSDPERCEEKILIYSFS